MSPTKKTLVTMLLLMLLPLTGCQSFVRRAPLPTSPKDTTKELVKHPEFQAAAMVAPNFVKEAFRIITKLELDVANHAR